MARGLRVRRLIRRTRHRILIVAGVLTHPDTPWYVWIVALAVVAYAASPIDLIPDFIPVLGQLDDLILLPLGIAIALRLAPPHVRRDAARDAIRGRKTPNPAFRWFVAAVIVVVWTAVAWVVVRKVAGRVS